MTYTQLDYYLGRPVDQQDPTGIVGSALFADALDRPTEVIRDNRSAPTKAGTRFVYDDANNVVTTYRDRDAYNDSKERTEVVFDGLGRETESRLYEGAGTSYIATRKGYDGLGRLSRVSNPFRPNGGETEQTTTTVYDALNRVVSVTTPDTATVTTVYQGNQTTVTDQAGKARRSFTDALGRLTTVVEDPAGLNYTTGYLYDTLDNLTTVAQGAQTRTFTDDSLSQLIEATNPESGNIKYGDSGLPGYDANGNLVRNLGWGVRFAQRAPTGHRFSSAMLARHW